MITNLLGKILFPHLQPWRRERETKTVLAAALVGLILAGAITWVIYSRYSAIK
jgi:high-affinity Fe2+/Pb2+ permease